MGSPHPAQKVHALLGFFHQNSDVVGPGQRAVNVDPQELGDGDDLYFIVTGIIPSGV